MNIKQIILEELMNESDWAWVDEVLNAPIKLEPSTVYYFLPPLNQEEIRRLIPKIDSGVFGRDALTEPLRQTDSENRLAHLVLFSTNSRSDINSWQYPTQGYNDYKSIHRSFEEHNQYWGIQRYIDGRKI